MVRLDRTLSISITLILLVNLSSLVAALSCGNIITENTILDADITGCTNIGLGIVADGVTLDCNGYTIEGINNINSYGINFYSIGRENITIKNCEIRGFQTGIKTFPINGGPSKNLTIDCGGREIRGWTNTSGHGIGISYTSETTVKDCVISNFKYGIFGTGSHDNNITGNVINNNRYGFLIGSSIGSIATNNWIYQNQVCYNTDYDIQINAGGNLGDENTCDNTNWDDQGIIGCTYPCTGIADSDGDGIPNENDNCPSVPNNDQTDSDSDGIGDACDTCNDFDGDGYGTGSYGNSGCTGGIADDCNDTVPFINPGAIEICNDGVDNDCDSEIDEGCEFQGSCGVMIEEDTILTKDITGCTGIGVYINSDNVVLDCRGHTISGLNDNSSGIGIRPREGSQNITIKNCNIKGFKSGIALLPIFAATNPGHMTVDCGGARITGFGEGHGIHTGNIYYSNITNCMITNFTRGIDGTHLGFSNISENIILGNTQYGIYIPQSMFGSSNTLRHNLVCGSGEDNMAVFVYANAGYNNTCTNLQVWNEWEDLDSLFPEECVRPCSPPDHDMINFFSDNCPHDYNPDQVDSDCDGIGDACDPELGERRLQKVTPSDGAEGDLFSSNHYSTGKDVSISGNTMVVGAPRNDEIGGNSGAAYVYEKDMNGDWTEVRKITAHDGNPGDIFGTSVAISGDVIVIGAPSKDYFDYSGHNNGKIYIYGRNVGGFDNWGMAAERFASDSDENDMFGRDVSISGDRIIVGASGKEGGAAYIFQKTSLGFWDELKRLDTSSLASFTTLGSSVYIDGNTAVVGAPNSNGKEGTAVIYARNHGGTDNWGMVKELKSSVPTGFYYFGTDVTVSGNIIAVGEKFTQNNAGTKTGAAYIFHKDHGGTNNWGEVKRIVPQELSHGPLFGISLSISGDIIAIGAPKNDGPQRASGSVLFYERNHGGTNNWGTLGELPFPEDKKWGYFGSSVSASGSAVVIGSGNNSDAGVVTGAAYIFELSDTTSDCDSDGFPNLFDNCISVSNPGQNDTDRDNIGDVCDGDIDGDGALNEYDNCLMVSNPEQRDDDGDTVGNQCDPDFVDTDNDLIGDDRDNCVNTQNTDQSDIDGDGVGDACDDDMDDDTIPNNIDNCPTAPNTGQTDSDSDGVGDACDYCPGSTDEDGDFICSNLDNCLDIVNSDQKDTDSDGLGDACDSCPNDPENDIDGDNDCGDVDNCPLVSNPDQSDTDSDGLGDACDNDIDGDTILNENDNCLWISNTGQSDIDSDGMGDACDLFPDDPITLNFEAQGKVKYEISITGSDVGATGGHFGYSIDNIGDFDGDGVRDFLVGDPTDNDGCPSGNPDCKKGAVYILLMNPGGAVKMVKKISDTAGGFTGTIKECDGFGSSVADVGDIDGDGVTDLAVGAIGALSTDYSSSCDAESGLWILLMNPDGTVRAHNKLTGAPESRFGVSVDGIGDINNDGVPDIVVGSWGGSGSVNIIFMLPDANYIKMHRLSGQDITDRFNNEDFHIGSAVANMGDIDGDGITDIAVGAEGYNNPPGQFEILVRNGAVFRVLLKRYYVMGDLAVQVKQSSKISGSPSSNRYTGNAVANIGDLDGDGVYDLAIGQRGYGPAPFDSPDEGRVILKFGGGGGGTINPDGLPPQGEFGRDLAYTGDIDGDGINDLVVGTRDDKIRFQILQPRPVIKLDRHDTYPYRYSWVDRGNITLYSFEGNKDSSAIEFVGDSDSQLNITTDSGLGSLIGYRLVETGPDTAIFTGSFALTGDSSYDADGDGIAGDAPGITSGIGPNDGRLATTTDTWLRVRYRSSDGGLESTMENIEWGTASICLGHEPHHHLAEHPMNSQMTVWVSERDMNFDPQGYDTLKVNVTSDSDPSGIQIVVTEASLSNLSFSGTLDLVCLGESSDSPPTLKVSPGETVRATYADHTPHTGVGNVKMRLRVTTISGSDGDGDCTEDSEDNCPAYNPDQADTDKDGAGDICDACPADDTDNCDTTESASDTVDTQGGIVNTSSGNAGVEIPQDALPSDTSIFVSGDTQTPDTNLSVFQAQTGSDAFSLIYTFGPEGTAFSDAVTITIKYNDTGLVDESDVDIYYYNEATGQWEPQGAVCDTVLNECYLNVTHFSDYIVGVFVDADADGYGVNTDCDDNDPNTYPGAEEVCDGKDNDCDEVIDEELGTTTCGVGVCEHTIDNCIDGIPQVCDPFEGASTEICDGLDNDCNGVVDGGGDILCDDGLFCNGQETCQGTLGCRPGVPVDCSGNSLAGIATCSNVPDSNPFTWDYRMGFVSVCIEPGICTTGTIELTHTCSVDECNAVCDDENPCEPNSCSETYDDYCEDKKLVEYGNDKIKDSATVEDSCDNFCLDECTCTDCPVNCSAPPTNTYCVRGVCGAECGADTDCEATGCDSLDGCYEGTYRDYSDADNSCCLDGCACTQNECTAFEEIITDQDGDGFDTECDRDCDDSDATVFLGAPELCDNKDNDCDGIIDEGGVCDSDGDGVHNNDDLCPRTPAGMETDPDGCSASQFCLQIDIPRRRGIVGGILRCLSADWKDNEYRFPRDCRIKWQGKDSGFACLARKKAD